MGRNDNVAMTLLILIEVTLILSMSIAIRKKKANEQVLKDKIYSMEVQENEM